MPQINNELPPSTKDESTEPVAEETKGAEERSSKKKLSCLRFGGGNKARRRPKSGASEPLGPRQDEARHERSSRRAPRLKRKRSGASPHRG